MIWLDSPDRMRRVVDTFSARRISVVTRSSVGNTLNCSGSATIIDVSRITTAPAMLTASRKSISAAGSGTTSTMTIDTTPKGMPIADRRLRGVLDARVRGLLSHAPTPGGGRAGQAAAGRAVARRRCSANVIADGDEDDAGAAPQGAPETAAAATLVHIGRRNTDRGRLWRDRELLAAGRRTAARPRRRGTRRPV